MANKLKLNELQPSLTIKRQFSVNINTEHKLAQSFSFFPDEAFPNTANQPFTNFDIQSITMCLHVIQTFKLMTAKYND